MCLNKLKYLLIQFRSIFIILYILSLVNCSLDLLESLEDEHELFKQKRSLADTELIPQNYSIYELPSTLNGGPSIVEISVVIMQVRDIKEMEEEISVELNLRVFWKDPRLAHIVSHLLQNNVTVPKAEYVLLKPILLQSIWHPDIFIDHVKKIEQPILMSKPASLRIYPDNTLRYSTRITIVVSCPFDFHFYPVDTQSCHFDSKSYAYTNKSMILTWKDKSGAGFAKNMDLPNFFIGLDNPTSFSLETKSGAGHTYSGLRFTILLTRKLSFHLIQTYIPSVVLVVISWLSFLVNPDSVPGRMTLLVTILLTLIAMFATIRTSTPNVSYVKYIDIWMITCVFFVFLALIEFTVVLKIKAMKFKPKRKTERLGNRTGKNCGGTSKPISNVFHLNSIPFKNSQKHGSIDEEIGEIDRDAELDEYDIGQHSSNACKERKQSIPTRRFGVISGLTGPWENSTITIYPERERKQSRNNSTMLFPGSASTSSQPIQQITIINEEMERSNEIVKTIENMASLIIPLLFFIFNLLYWPILMVTSQYIN